MANDAEATFHDFVVTRSAGLYRLARLLVADPGRAEDLLQTTLLRTWRSWPKVSRAANPDAYVGKIMVNAAISRWHRLWRREFPTAFVPDLLATDAYTAVDEWFVLIAAVRALPPRQRAAIVLRYFCDLDDDAIAASLGCATSTVRSQISRALVHLRVDAARNPLSPTDESDSELK